MNPPPVDIELLIVPDCPNAEPAHNLLRSSLRAAGLPDASIHLSVIDSQRAAEQRGFIGSPTILVNGIDPFTEPGRPAGLACRVYPGPDGLPPVERLRAAVTARRVRLAIGAATNQTEDLVRRGLGAWTEGDHDSLEPVLDPAVTLRWIEPGEWDCAGREEVMQLLRDRQAEGRGPHPMRIQYIDERTVVVSLEVSERYGTPATRIGIAVGAVVAMQHCTSREAALAEHTR